MGSGAGSEAFKLDALREVANIGAGHAASALSQIMTDRRVFISVPEIKLIRSDAVAELFGHSTFMIVAVWMDILGDLPGRMALAMPVASAKLLCDFMLDREPGTTTELEDMERSTMAEAGNILGSAYLNALSDFLDLSLLPSVPTLLIDNAVDLAGRSSLEPEQTVLCSATAFAFPDGELDQTLTGQFLHLPQSSSLGTLLGAILE